MQRVTMSQFKRAPSVVLERVIISTFSILHPLCLSSISIDANVYLSLIGDKTKLERYQLKESVDKKKNLFEKGSADRFRINTSELGTVSLRISTSFSIDFVRLFLSFSDQNNSNRTRRNGNWRWLVFRFDRNCRCCTRTNLQVKQKRKFWAKHNKTFGLDFLSIVGSMLVKVINEFLSIWNRTRNHLLKSSIIVEQ